MSLLKGFTRRGDVSKQIVVQQRGTLPAENPSVSLSDPAIWDILASGARSTAGVSVNRETVLGYPAVWRCVSLISCAVGKTDCDVFRMLEPRGKEVDRDHPAHALIWRRVNPLVDAMSFRQTLTSHALITGNGYGWILRDGAGDPQQVVILDPTQTIPMRENGRLFYLTTLKEQNGNPRRVSISPENMIHIRGLSWDALSGYSIVDILKEALGLGMAAQTYGSVFFANNARPGWVIEMPGKFKDAEAVQQFRDDMGSVHGGLLNAHQPAVLQNGAKVHAFPVNNDEAQFLQTREFEVRQIANIFGVAPHRLGSEIATSHSSLEQETQATIDDAYLPWFRRWEYELETKLLREVEQEGETHVIRFDMLSLVHADLPSRSDFYAMALNNRLMSPNEVRDRENLNPYEGGDDILSPLNMGNPGGDPDDETEPMEEPGEEDETTPMVNARLLLERTLARMVDRLTTTARTKSQHPAALMNWILTGMFGQRTVYVDALSPIVAETVTTIGGSTGTLAEHLVSAMLSELHEGLNGVAGSCTTETIVDGVDGYTASICRTLPAGLVNSFLQDVYDAQRREKISSAA